MTSKPAIAALAFAGAAAAFSVDFTKVSSGQAPFSFASGAKDDAADDSFGYANLNNASGSDIYVAELSVAGKTYTVQLDTGSSDLWLDTTGADLSGLTQTGIQTGLTYGDGTVAFGPVYVGNVTFGDFSVSQAFISAPGTNATTNNDNGLLGVGPPKLSAIKDALDNTNFEEEGNTLIDNIFAVNTSLPQISTFSLSRSFATGSTDGGTYTIGEVNSTLSNITNQPKLEVVSSSRWIVLLDGIVVNGQNFSGDSMFEVSGQSSGQTLANLDTGTSLAQIPTSYAEAIYGSIPGAQRFSSSGIYSVPCDTQIELSFVFGGVEYPVHPIDTVAATTDDSGNIICYSGFPFTDSSSSEDFLLGDSFLRNVYQLYSYGSFGSDSSTATPYIQLLSTTDAQSASSEFETLSKERNQTLSTAASSGGGSSNSGAVGMVSGGPSAAVIGVVSLAALFGSLLM